MKITLSFAMAGLAIYSLQILIRWILDTWAATSREIEKDCSMCDHFFPKIPYPDPTYLDQLWSVRR